MSNEIVLASDWQSMKEQADMLVKSGLLPNSINTPEKAIVIMLQSRELGIGYMQGLNGINVIQGKPTISPQLMLALIYNSGKLEDMEVDSQTTYCTVTMKRHGQTPHSETFTLENATALGLATRDNWKKQPAVMLKWRAISACARVVFPDVVIGMYTHEEISPDISIDAETGEIVGDVAELPEMVESTPSDHQDAPQVQKASDKQHMPTHGDYIDRCLSPQEASIYDMNKPVCKLTGEEMHQLKADLLAELKKNEPKMVERHMMNRINKRFDVKSIIEVQDTVLDFWGIMTLTHDKWAEEIGEDPLFSENGAA